MSAIIDVPDPHMPITEISLGKLRDLLANVPGHVTFRNGFEYPHSWRGYYAEAAVEPATDVTAADMANSVYRLLSETFEGYKGGDYTYSENTPTHLSEYGTDGEYDWSPILIALEAVGLGTTNDDEVEA